MVGVTAIPSVKINLAKKHMKSAQIFRDEAKKIESIFSKVPEGEFSHKKKEKHRAYTIAGIYSVVAAMDSYAYEFIKKIEDEYERIESDQDRLVYEGIEDCMVKQIAEYSDSDYKDPMDKLSNCRSSRSLNCILEIMGLEEFSEKETFQKNYDTIVTMRNKLSHHKPKWVEGSSKDPENVYNIEKDLQGEFELNPLYPPGDAFFPRQIQSASCLDWCIRWASKLVEEFADKVNIDETLTN